MAIGRSRRYSRPARCWSRTRRCLALPARAHRRVTADRLPVMERPADNRSYSPGLEGVLAGETSLALVDGANGRLLYRGYPIVDLVRAGTYAQVAELLWTGEWPESAHLPAGKLSDAVLTALRALPENAIPMDALRTAVSVWGAENRLTYP